MSVNIYLVGVCKNNIDSLGQGRAGSRVLPSLTFHRRLP